MVGSSDASVTPSSTMPQGLKPQRKRKPRPSKARGLRTSTGCLTCRRRRVKCLEGRPRCVNCVKSERICEYACPTESVEADDEAIHHLPSREQSDGLRGPPNDDGNASGITEQTLAANSSGSKTQTPGAVWSDPAPHIAPQADPFALDSPGTVRSSLFDQDLATLEAYDQLGTAPIDWYDLLAADAIDHFQRYQENDGLLWDFDVTSLSRRRSPAPGYDEAPELLSNNEADIFAINENSLSTLRPEPWNTSARVVLNGNQAILLQHYIDTVGPILDLYDPDKHFTVKVPHLAMRNEGLLNSILAVAARHQALITCRQSEDGNGSVNHESNPNSEESSFEPRMQNPSQLATVYYYETLRYLSQNLLYKEYSQSLEILATAIMISTYEMFDAYVTSNHSNWERHLQGAYWIQRTQDNNAESQNSLQRAVWWAWLRQDVWAAFLTGRPAMTIFRPKRSLANFDSVELAKWITFLSAKCVQFAARPKNGDINAHAERGRALLKALDEWKRVLPSSFDPIEIDVPPKPYNIGQGSVFKAVWIHPPSHAAAIQTYHFSRIVVLLHEPAMGGPVSYRVKEKLLQESLSMICGIALAEQSLAPPLAFVSLQNMFAAGHCARSAEMEHAILDVVTKVLFACRIPQNDIISSWTSLWNEGA